jgi:tetraacyldisaccharide 4'-kinase
VICVGNISVGGTGKTPHVLAIAELLSNQKPGVLSRGYGRKTKGFKWVQTSSLASEVGDEPLLIKKRMPNIPVAVSEDRVAGAQRMLVDNSGQLDCLILDDAFQHRRIARDLNIVLSRYDKPFYEDIPLPKGRLREDSNRALDRTDIVVVTHCPSDINIGESAKPWREALMGRDIPLLFSTMKSAGLLDPKGKLAETIPEKALAMAGIAHPSSFVNGIRELYPHIQLEVLTFSDHHTFTKENVDHMINRSRLNGNVIITTEKDLVRLNVDHFLASGVQIYTLPIVVDFLSNGKDILQRSLRELF